MQRVSQVIGFNALAVRTLNAEQSLASNIVYKQCMRWKRKPIWLPTAKTKVFRVPKRPEIPEEERTEILRLYNNYRTYMKSIRSHFAQATIQSRMQKDEAYEIRIAEEDFLKCNERNVIWNAQVAAQREKRLAQEKEIKLENALASIELKKARDAKRQKAADEEIRRMKEESVNFITEENVEQAIAAILDTVVDYNAAVNLSGERLTAKTTDSSTPTFNETNLRYEMRRKELAKN